MEPKEFYESPLTQLIEVEQEGMACASGGDYPKWPGEDI